MEMEHIKGHLVKPARMVHLELCPGPDIMRTDKERYELICCYRCEWIKWRNLDV